MKKTEPIANSCFPEQQHRFMKYNRVSLLVTILMLFSLLTRAQLIGWDASSNGGGFGASPWTPATLNTNLSMSGGGLIRGSSVLTSGTPAASCWGGSGGWGTADAGSIYFSFTANTGYNISLSSITSALRRSGSGPSSCNIEYTLNGSSSYTTAGAWNVTSTSGTTGTANSTTLSGFTNLQNITAGTVVKFRITFPGASGGNWYLTGSTNCLKLNGTITAVPSCTTPAGIVTSNITANSADLTWNALTGVTGFQYVLDQTSANPSGAGTAITTPSYSATGLTDESVYYLHVRTNCGGSSFSGWAITSFTTPAACLSPTIQSITGNTVICDGDDVSLTANLMGTGPFTYTWTGPGTFHSTSVSTPTVTNATSGNFSVSVSNACGTTSETVYITVNPLPLISVNTPSVCAGSSATLLATGANTYTWSNTQTTSSISVNPMATSDFTVTGTDANGCIQTNTTSVTFYILPVVSANSTTICAGSSVTLSATGANTYTWSTSQTTSSITVNPTTTTMYTVTGTDLNGCMNTTSSTVTAIALPAISVNNPTVCAGSAATLTATGASTYTWSTTQTTSSITVSPATTSIYNVTGMDLSGCINSTSSTVTALALPAISVNNPTVCAGSAATLTATGASTYTWSTTQTNSSITVSPATTSIYNVTGMDLSGCMNSTSSTVTALALPAISVNNPTVCAGSPATLTAMGANTYTWSTTQTTSSITVNPTTITIYTVTGTDLNGCKNNHAATVVVNILPSVTVNTTSICAGATATLTASGANTYTWSTMQSVPSITLNPIATATYTVTGTDLNHCSNTFTTLVNVTSTPVITVNSGTICSGSTAILNASGVTTYTWSNGSNATTISVSPTASTVYTVSGQLAGCPVTVVKTSTITVNPLPIVSITPVTGALCHTSPTLPIAANPAGGSFSGIGMTGNTFDPQVSGPGTFSISYSYTGSNSCSNTANTTVSVTICTGVEDYHNESSVQAYPNPAQEVIHVKFESISNALIRLYDVNGHLVYSQEYSGELHTINLNAFHKGLYILKITTIKGEVNKKILVQ